MACGVGLMVGLCQPYSSHGKQLASTIPPMPNRQASSSPVTLHVTSNDTHTHTYTHTHTHSVYNAKFMLKNEFSTFVSNASCTTDRHSDVGLLTPHYRNSVTSALRCGSFWLFYCIYLLLQVFQQLYVCIDVHIPYEYIHVYVCTFVLRMHHLYVIMLLQS